MIYVIILFITIIIIYLLYIKYRKSSITSNNQIIINIPVTHDKLFLAFSMDQNLNIFPPILKWTEHIIELTNKWGTNPREIIVIIHGPSCPVALNNENYKKIFNIDSPYKSLVKKLMKDNVKFEICGYSMAINNWNNNMLIENVKVNTGAIMRIVQLENEGFNVVYL